MFKFLLFLFLSPGLLCSSPSSASAGRASRIDKANKSKILMAKRSKKRRKRRGHGAKREEPPHVIQARKHVLTGIRLFQDQEYGPALAEFQHAYDLYPHSFTIYNIAVCHSHLGDYLTAEKKFREALSAKPPPPRKRRMKIQSELKRLSKLIATIRFQLNVPEAKVTIGKRSYVVRNNGMIRASSGIHVVEVQAKGHVSEKRQVTLTGGMPTSLVFRLKAISVMNVTSKIPGAKIYYNGKEIGSTPYKGRIHLGSHRIGVASSGKVPWEGTIQAKPGRTVNVNVDLADPKKGLGQHWFWIATGATVTFSAMALGFGLKQISAQNSYDKIVREIHSGEEKQEEGQKLQDDLRNFTLATNLSIAFCVISAGTTVALSFFTRFRDPQSNASISMALFGKSGIGVSAVSEWP